MKTTLLIKHTEESQISDIIKIYDKAREYMRRTGNIHQWNDGYPSEETLRSDMEKGCSYVCMLEGRIVATFFFEIGEEPTYKEIEGLWPNNEEYGVIHRVASDGTVRGVMHKILDYCFQHISNIRIDTHSDNTTMRNSLLRYGFTYCGIIHLLTGAPRLAYHHCLPN